MLVTGDIAGYLNIFSGWKVAEISRKKKLSLQKYNKKRTIKQNMPSTFRISAPTSNLSDNPAIRMMNEKMHRPTINILMCLLVCFSFCFFIFGGQIFGSGKNIVCADPVIGAQ